MTFPFLRWCFHSACLPLRKLVENWSWENFCSHTLSAGSARIRSGLISPWSLPSSVRATVHLSKLPADPSTFLNSCPALHKHPPRLHTPLTLLPASCFPLTLSPELYFLLSVISLLPLISLATSVLSSPALPCFLLSTCVMFASILTHYCFWHSQTHVFIRSAYLYPCYESTAAQCGTFSTLIDL